MLVEAAYGKSSVQLVRVTRHGDRHDLRDLTVAIRFEGDYGESYTDGDNTGVLPTDTMKNTVYALAGRDGVTEPEAFGVALARHFLDRNPLLRHVRIDLLDHLWGRIHTGGREHGQAFVRVGPDSRTARIAGTRDRTVIDAGVTDLLIMKTGHSAFTGYPRDEFTTLPETRDRILATALTATWRYTDVSSDFAARSSKRSRSTTADPFSTRCTTWEKRCFDAWMSSSRFISSCRTGITCRLMYRRSASRIAMKSLSRRRNRTG